MSQRVLLVNKFYYPRGGDCIVVLNTEALLRDNGVEAEVFAMKYPQNLMARYQSMFASEVNFGGGMGNMVRAMKRTLGLGDVRSSFEAVLDEYRPDVVHLHNVHSYLSPVVGELAHQRGICVVWTLHDYKLLCPRYDCLLDGKPCERCHKGRKSAVLTHRCMKGSLPASAVAWFEALKWNRRRLEANTDLFVCPSEFMADKMRAGGFDSAKVKVLNNFLDPVKFAQYQAIDNTVPREDYYCFVGRLSPEKGVADLLAVASRLPYRFKVAGGGPLEAELREKYSSCDNIEFLGMLDASGVVKVLTGARLSVIPSQWYENNPLSVVESLCAGTPVAGSQMGGIPELIGSENGVVFQAFNQEAMATAITMSMARRWNHSQIARQALERFGAKAHLRTLLKDIYGF
ncbi:MAG: glycosyltransferase [Muribaculaceae bacterium]|nr:glycosyltransferase [Muribaculaceae bacterium]